MPAPVFTNMLNLIKIKDGGKSQNLKLFSRGKAMSGEFKSKGISQFAYPPIKIGIIKKKIIKKA